MGIRSLETVTTDIHQKYEALKQFQTHGEAGPEEIRDALVDLRDDFRAVPTILFEEAHSVGSAMASKDLALFTETLRQTIYSADMIDVCLASQSFENRNHIAEDVSLTVTVCGISSTVSLVQWLAARIGDR